MWGSAIYGFVGALITMLFLEVAPQPAGSMIWWGFLAAQLTWTALLCWRRTRLPFATAAMALGAAGSATLAALAAAGYALPEFPRVWWLPFGVFVLSAPLLFHIESRVHASKWRQWRDHMELANAWDILTGRHIPHLRDERP